MIWIQVERPAGGLPVLFTTGVFTAINAEKVILREAVNSLEK
jgi:hypothetical protein